MGSFAIFLPPPNEELRTVQCRQDASCAHGFNGIVEFLQALSLRDAAIVDTLASIADVDIFSYWPTAEVFAEVNRALLKTVFSYRSASCLQWRGLCRTTAAHLIPYAPVL